MNQTLVNIFTFLEKIGLVDVLLPFVLVFVIVFGVLERTKVLGKGKTNANKIVSVAMAFMVVAVINYTNIINDIARIFGLLVVMALSFILIYGLFGKDIALIKKKAAGQGKSSGGGSGGGSGGSSSSKPSGSSKNKMFKDAEKVADWDISKPPLNDEILSKMEK
jgi:uncharacterized membrane protein YgcG